MIGRFPMCVLHLTMPFESADVNVHPNKWEVRFQDERGVRQAVETIVELCAKRLPENMGIPADQIQVLTPTRKGLAGTASLFFISSTVLDSGLLIWVLMNMIMARTPTRIKRIR